MADDRSSLAKAIASEADRTGPRQPLPDPEQLEMLRRPDGTFPFEEVRAVRGRGRPRGASNKRSLRLAQLIVQEHGDPVLAMASLYARPLDQIVALCAASGKACTPMEALQLQLRAMQEVAPYVHGKMPVAVDMTIRGDMSLVIEGMTHSSEEVRDIVNGEFVPVDDADEEMADFCEFPEGEK